MEKIYMAGPLFTEAEVNQRIREYKSLKTFIEESEIDTFIFTPIMAPQNDKSKLPTAEDIFLGDEKELLSSDVVFADLSGEDPGVMMEIGQILYNKDIKIIPYLSDIRTATSGEYSGIYIPWGYNQYVIGGLENYGHTIYPSFNEALEAYKKTKKTF